MKSGVLSATTWHERLHPSRHTFRYPYHALVVDLDEWETLNDCSPLFKIDRFAALSLRGADYLKSGFGPSPRGAVNEVFSKAGIAVDTARILLITMPRVFGYVFNPASFFLSFDARGEITGIVAQVRNTFGDMHLYPAAPSRRTPEGSTLFEFAKCFYVSPFFDLAGEYQLEARTKGSEWYLAVRLLRNRQLAFSADISGAVSALTSRQIWRSFPSLAISAWTAMVLIHFEAFRLRFLRRLQAFMRPLPASSWTVRSSYSIVYAVRKALLKLFGAQNFTS